MEIFDVILDDNDLGLFATSLVERPAIKQEFVYFNENTQIIILSEDDKQEIIAPLLIPNQLIYRVDEDNVPYYIKFSEEVIEELALRFVTSGSYKNFTLHHENFDAELSDRVVGGVEVLKLWTIESLDDEINTKYNFNLPIGTLCLHSKINDKNIWDKVKSGEVKGYSIEGVLNLVKSDK